MFSWLSLPLMKTERVSCRTSIRNLKDIAMERRGATRYRLSLVVTFLWKDESGSVHRSEGKKRDLNGRGIYVDSHLVPPIGSSVEMHVLLPQLAMRPAELHAEGRVVRIDQSAGFAAMNHTAILRDAEGREINGEDSWKDFEQGEPTN
jgi:hypothetical protein